MPRPLVLGNGRLLVQMDSRGRIRDLYWPTVGLLNHVGGHNFRLGVYCDSQFSWTDAVEWSVEQMYKHNSLIGETAFRCQRFPFRLVATDLVEEDRDVFRRTLTIENVADEKKTISVFFHQDMCIAESCSGDTALQHRELGVVQYKRQFAFAFNAESDGSRAEEAAIGIKGIDGLRGTWIDAEDGDLTAKAIEQGSVDSTIKITTEVAPSGNVQLRYTISCGSSINELSLSRQTTVSRERNDEAWLAARTPSLEPLPETLQNLFRQSLLIIRSQIDSGGAILAANDSDVTLRGNPTSYSYVWPRDGAIIASVLDRVGEHKIPRRFFEFCLPLISAEQPYFLQKYCADGSLGATWLPWSTPGVLPIQQDETALVLIALADHIRATGDTAWLKEIYEQFVSPMAEFLCSFRNPATGLPMASYDLWEERLGVHAFTVTTVIGALSRCAELATLVGSPREAHFHTTSVEIRKSLLAKLVDGESGLPIRSLMGRSHSEVDRTPDASLLLLARHAGLGPEEQLVRDLNDWIESSLTVPGHIGGIARYPGDWYNKRADLVTGNPWVICTMWLAQAKIAAAKAKADLEEPLRLLNWVSERSETTGVLAEQYDPITGDPLSVSPLTWSHAEFVATCLDYCEKARALGS